MECNKDEAIRAKEMAEKKMENNDFEGARKIALKAQNLYPELDNIAQMLSICDVHCSAQKRLGSEKDWYGILQVEKLSDDQIIKKQYRRLALILHPDKNRFPGAEGAFKLICEANVLLSDPAKKSVYDNKIRVLSRSAPTNPPNNYINRSSQPSKQHNAQSKGSNGFGSLNQHQATQPVPSARRDAFWTWCPYCKVRYQYYRQYLNRSLQCPTCSKVFITREVGAQQHTLHMPPEPVPRQPAGFQEKVVPNPANFKMGAMGPSASHTESQQTASQKTGNLKTEETGNCNTRKEGMEGRNRSWKGGKKQAVESNDSSDSDIEDLSMKISEFSDARLRRRSSRKRQHISYKEPDEEDHTSSFKRAGTTKEDKGKEQKDAVDSKDPEHGNPNKEGKDADCDEEGKKRGVTGGNSPVEIESDSDGDTSSHTKSDTGLLQCPDPEFSDFEKARDASHFEANQFWACYDTLDSMPRFYAKVKKVRASPFELHITWLEAQPLDETYEKWVDEELPVGCGIFKLGTSEKTDLRMSFSHQVHCEKGKKRGSLTIYPREGEVWAIFKDWDKSWSSDPDNHKQFKYEVVQVLKNFVPGIGVLVGYLDKISGFASLFQRATSEGETDSFVIGPDELYKFSHSVPCFKMSGSEREGVPIGSFELDPASLPLNPDDLYYPCKPGHRNLDPGVSSSLPKNAKEKGKSVASDGTDTPKKHVDLEEMSKMRRSPRGVNVSKKNTN